MISWLSSLFFGSSRKVSLSSIIADAIENLQLVLDGNNETLLQVLSETESTESQAGIEVAFDKLNDTMRYLLRADQGRENFSHIRGALMSFDLTKRFSDHLLRGNSLGEAIRCYKSEILQNLSYNLRKRKREDLEFKEMDQELIHRYLHGLYTTPENNKKNKIDQNEGSCKRRRIFVESPRHIENGSAAHFNDHYGKRKTKVCSKFLNGKCRRGESCYYIHESN